MSTPGLIVQTPQGSSIKRTQDGQFMVCDSDNHCHFTRNLYLAEEELNAMELGYCFPYSTNFRKHSHCHGNDGSVEVADSPS